MAEPKKHHFSPVFYLNGWCDETTGQLIAYFRSKKNDVRAKAVYPKATGYELLLYTMEGLPDDQKQMNEKDYMAAKVDDLAAEALRVLVSADTSALTGALREAWTRFMIASLHRRPAAVAEIGETEMAPRNWSTG